MSIAKSAIAALSAVATAATVAFATPAAAQAPRSVVVSYADLNLASATGQDLLDQRIRRAAGTVCGDFGPQPAMNMLVSGCRATAATDARAKVATILAARDTAPAGGALIVTAR